MYVYWTDNLSVGVELIDNQHKELMNRVNSLLKACETGIDLDNVETDLLAFMNEFVVYHFNAEEELMRRHDYPDFEEHQQIHQQFKKKLDTLTEELKRASFAKKTFTEFNYAVVDLVTDHIQNVDRKMAKFILSKS